MPVSVTDKVYNYDDVHRFVCLSIQDVSELTKKVRYTLLPPTAHIVTFLHLTVLSAAHTVRRCMVEDTY
jgi:hypothetical protein